MKALIPFLFLAASAFAQDPSSYLNNFDSKVYSLKNKGVQDFVVDIESPKLTQQLNDQQLFGKVDSVIFRTYWTAKPERLAIEVVGLPEGFTEIKENLKAGILGVMDNLIPPTTAQKFASYKFASGSKSREIIAKDSTGLAPVPSFTLKFDQQDRLSEVTGNKPVGTLIVTPVYEKESFAEGKWVLTEQITKSTDNGRTLTIKKELDYGKAQGMGVLTEVEVTTEQKGSSPEAKAVSSTETILFKNYKINEGAGLKYFLGDSKTGTSGEAK